MLYSSSAGIGGFPHLSTELFKLKTGVNLVHVPFEGGGPAVADIIAGTAKVMIGSLVQTTPNIKAGKLRALGTGGVKRSSVLPDVPTIAEAGVPGYQGDQLVGHRRTRRHAAADRRQGASGDRHRPQVRRDQEILREGRR